MFILIYFIFFDLKKSSISVYYNYIVNNMYINFMLIKTTTMFTQFTIFNSKTMTLGLLIIWFIYTFMGEFLILLEFNYVSFNESNYNLFFINNDYIVHSLNLFSFETLRLLTYII